MTKQHTKRDLPKKSENISDWYNRVVMLSELADYGPARGTMIFRPYGYRVWELMQAFMDRLIKEKGVDNAYFPMFIPMSLLEKEEEHVEGFSPELAVVTHGGGEELAEKLAVRPTSETIMYDSYSRWIQSWRDLPVLINQWNNVVRWEKRTYLFLRTSEFLWQEGHTAHATHDEAWDYVLWAMDMYKETYEKMYALPGIVGKKSASEKFPGALETLTFESLMPGGKALQSCTSHDLAQNFSVPFDITFLDREGEQQHVWQTSWGFSTRSMGGFILAHGDDQGLVIPPAVAPYQVVILQVHETDEVATVVNNLASELKTAGIRFTIDNREGESLGYKINKWELKGVPVRVEIGSKEATEGKLTAVRRDNGEKSTVAQDNAAVGINELLQTIQQNLYNRALQFQDDNTHVVDDYEEFRRVMDHERGFIRAMWCEDASCEASIKEETKATTRCLPLDAQEEDGKCVYCGKPARHRWYFALAY
ncbi:proline--tRNA ligase [candidate division WWE3 bacterium]|uniref:Proline--tRNA ligase n=1 Tax=candidate division WWE3 bacterium TaxID=2053526 RepID=A0A955LKQ0_UNCKA|nr:proline--tRNA ligase [candidate division WWE3 bacterium]